MSYFLLICILQKSGTRRAWLKVSAFSERVGVRLLLDGHPLPLSEFVPVGRAADARAVAGCARAAERHMRLVGDSLVVDVKQAGVELVADGDGAADVRREHAGRKAVFVLVGELHRFVVAADRGDRRDRAE